jgi:hypothetical protein
LRDGRNSAVGALRSSCWSSEEKNRAFYLQCGGCLRQSPLACPPDSNLRVREGNIVWVSFKPIFPAIRRPNSGLNLRRWAP